MAKVQNDNNRALIESLNSLGAGQVDDAFATGGRMMGALQRGLDAEKGNVNTLYNLARDSAGRSFPLDGHTFTTQASQLLDDALLGGALPPSVSQHLNRIAVGEVPLPWTMPSSSKLRWASYSVLAAMDRRAWRWGWCVKLWTIRLCLSWAGLAQQQAREPLEVPSLMQAAQRWASRPWMRSIVHGWPTGDDAAG